MTAQHTDPTRIVTTRWYWVRHAPVPDGGRVYGQRDLDCDCTDEPVFKAVAALLPADAHWVTSNLKRTTQTAAAIIAASAGRHAPRDIPAIPALAEQHMGEWQGMERNAFRKLRGMTEASFWMTRGDERAPAGESFHDLVARVDPVIHDINAKHGGRNIIAVTHGGTIRAAMRLALGLDPDACHAFVIENVSITVLDHLATPTGPLWRVGAVNQKPWGERSKL